MCPEPTSPAAPLDVPPGPPLAWLHFGDLHVDADDGYASLRTFEALVAEANAHLAAGVDFAYLPGDNANHGEAAQYAGIRRAADALRLPLHVIPGDHDFEPGSLDAFYAAFARRDAADGGRRLPYAITVKGRRCLFLDVVSAGAGGPDLRLAPDQHRWVEQQLAAESANPRRPVVFMHAFPGDLRAGGQALARCFAAAHVAFVSTGHTHYNELLNDGSVVYSAARSTGQVEEGPSGFAIGAVDGNAPSWRFKPLESPWPFVLITSPADVRLSTAGGAAGRGARVRALVLGGAAGAIGPDGPGALAVSLAVDGATPVAMWPTPDAPALWTGDLPPLAPGAHTVVVAASGGGRIVDHDAITLVVDDPAWAPPPPAAAAPDPDPNPQVLGDHRSRVGNWPTRGVLGTRLGPNADGRKW